jgi:hypothetical protein
MIKFVTLFRTRWISSAFFATAVTVAGFAFAALFFAFAILPVTPKDLSS